MPILRQNPTLGEYTANPTRATIKDTALPEPEKKAFVSFNYVDMLWMIATAPETFNDAVEKGFIGPMLASLPINWLDGWEEAVYAVIPTGESALGTLYATILAKHNIKYTVVTEDAMKYNPETDVIYIINTDFELNSADVKDAVKSKTTAFDMLNRIIEEKTDIKRLYFIANSKGVIEDLEAPWRPEGEEEITPEQPGESDDTSTVSDGFPTDDHTSF